MKRAFPRIYRCPAKGCTFSAKGPTSLYKHYLENPSHDLRPAYRKTAVHSVTLPTEPDESKRTFRRKASGWRFCPHCGGELR